MRQFGFATVMVGLLAVSAAGQEAVTIKISRAKAGDRVKVTKTETESNTSMFEIGGKEQKKSEDKSLSTVYVDEIIIAAEKKGPALKLIRTYEKYESSAFKPGTTAPPLKAAILIEKKDGKYSYTVEGKAVEKGVAGLLDLEFAKSPSDVDDEDLLPKGPVKPGESWKPNVPKLLKDLGADGKLIPDEEKTTMLCKLVSTSKKDGKQFGVIEVKLDIGIKGLGGDMKIPLKSGKMVMNMSGNVCLDGSDPSETATEEMTFTMDAEVNGIEFKVIGKAQKKETKELLPKK